MTWAWLEKQLQPRQGDRVWPQNFGLTNMDSTYLLVCRCELRDYSKSNFVSRLVIILYNSSLMSVSTSPLLAMVKSALETHSLV